MRLLVTGGAGFIGSNFIRYWLKKYPKDQIVNLDKLTYAGHLTSTKDFGGNSNYTFIKGDICSPTTVSHAMKDVDVVVHFAAESHVDRSIIGPKVFIKTNVIGTQVLLDEAVKRGVKRFHHVSTDEVYGALPLSGVEKFSEKSCYKPNSPYSASKAASDHLVRAYHTTYGLNITITNTSNNYGPFQDPEKLLPRFITNLIDSKDVPIYGDGKNVRDWLYVEDHCSAIDLVINKGKVGETYLVGGLTHDINNLKVTNLLLEAFGFDHSKIRFVADRSGHDRRYAVNWTKIKNLGWRPQHDFEKWLIETIKWYKDNEWWWRPLKLKSEKMYSKTKQK
ncbi:dTDP-glucose 4,6-dehydratase [Candidatus Woesebacteria bacterium]|nr:MAG: dTDP-glucose 4,6-dehydratase [Candidatus Woesebacteria bacterium]